MFPIPFKQVRKDLSLLYCIIEGIVRMNSIGAKAWH
jgi:hypothetical protein